MPVVRQGGPNAWCAQALQCSLVLVWLGEKKMVWWGWEEMFISGRVKPSLRKAPKIQWDVMPWAHPPHGAARGRCSLGRRGDQEDSIPSGLRKLSGSQKCAGLVRNPATSCWNTLLETGLGWAGSDWQCLLLPGVWIKLLFMASSVCRSGSQPRQETIWLRVLENSSHGIYR